MMGASGLAEALVAEAKGAVPAKPGPAEAASDGLTLADLLAKGPLATDLATSRIAELADVLAADRNAVHGALSPRHIRYASKDFSGRPTILAPDAVRLDPLEAAAYLAPELARTAANSAEVEPATLAADIYALGCILFECLTGRPPFKGKTEAEVQKRHATAAAPAVRQVRLDCELPPALEIEIQRALKKRPGDRHPSLQHLSQALRAAVRDDDRATMALGSGEAAFLQQLLQQQGGEADSALTPRSTAAARAARVPSALQPAMPLSAPPAPVPPLSRPVGPPPASRAPHAPLPRASATPRGQAPEAPAVAIAEAPASTGRKVGLLIAAVLVVVTVAALAIWQVAQVAPKPPVVARNVPIVAQPRAVPPVVTAEVPVPVPAPVPVAVEPDIMAEPVDVQVALEEPDAGSASPTAAKGEHKPRKSSGTQGNSRTAPTTTEEKKATGHDGPITF